MLWYFIKRIYYWWFWDKNNVTAQYNSFKCSWLNLKNIVGSTTSLCSDWVEAQLWNYKMFSKINAILCFERMYTTSRSSNKHSTNAPLWWITDKKTPYQCFLTAWTVSCRAESTQSRWYYDHQNWENCNFHL